MGRQNLIKRYDYTVKWYEKVDLPWSKRVLTSSSTCSQLYSFSFECLNHLWCFKEDIYCGCVFNDTIISLVATTAGIVRIIIQEFLPIGDMEGVYMLDH